MIKVAYIIGPIRSKWGLVGRLINVWRGRQVAVELWKAGFAVICPHLNSFTIAMAIPEDEIVRLDLEVINRCDFVVFCGDWGNSRGAMIERDHCMTISKKRYYNINTAILHEKS